MGSRLIKSRIERLEQRNGPTSYSSHGWGKSPEEVSREFAELPVEIARRAGEIRERRNRGEPEDRLLLSGTGGDLAALCVSYGRPEDVPCEVAEMVAERDRRAYSGVPEEAARMMKDLWIAVVAQAFEYARSASQANASEE